MCDCTSSATSEAISDLYSKKYQEISRKYFQLHTQKILLIKTKLARYQSHRVMGQDTLVGNLFDIRIIVLCLATFFQLKQLYEIWPSIELLKQKVLLNNVFLAERSRIPVYKW